MFVPDKYISTKLKLALAIFSESSKSDLPQREKMNTMILKIDGTFDEPGFHVIE
jgi:hypothetical protein